ncbi:MAG: hypothetical protein LQ350_005866 [Teloschistes chrysophthalmus]|nr:MAG: hypothetical protein LQ350_005866 [Niorma chrysophthalma]
MGRLGAAAQGFFDPGARDRANNQARYAEINTAYAYCDMEYAYRDGEYAAMEADRQRQRARCANQAARRNRELAIREHEKNERLQLRGLPRAAKRGFRAGVMEGAEAGYEAAMRDVQEMMGPPGGMGPHGYVGGPEYGYPMYDGMPAGPQAGLEIPGYGPGPGPRMDPRYGPGPQMDPRYGPGPGMDPRYGPGYDDPRHGAAGYGDPRHGAAGYDDPRQHGHRSRRERSQHTRGSPGPHGPSSYLQMPAGMHPSQWRGYAETMEEEDEVPGPSRGRVGHIGRYGH